MHGVEVDTIVNWDETSASFSKFRPTFGRGEGEIVMNEWRIGDKTYSAIAAITTLGFLPCTKIFDVSCNSSAIQHFLDGRQPFLLTTSVGHFDNASVNTSEESLQAVERVFGGRWTRISISKLIHFMSLRESCFTREKISPIERTRSDEMIIF